MANDEDLRTPEQIKAYAKECSRCAEETRAQGEALLKQADEWDALAASARGRFEAVRTGSSEQHAVPSAAKVVGSEKPAAKKAPAKRAKR